MENGKIILLNGVSSAGKTTLAKALQAKLDVPLYSLSCDAFAAMAPERFCEDDLDGQIMITQRMMRETIRLFSDKGLCVVVDDVVLDLPDKNDWLYDYSVLLAGYPVLFVHVTCPLDELVRRQTQRGDRMPNQAQWQLDHAYTNIPYDLTVDTHQNSAEECAEQIISLLDQPHEWSALAKIKTQIEASRKEPQ